MPYDRGDVLAAVHREGEVLTESAEAERQPGCGSRVDQVGTARFREFVVDA